MTIVCPHCGKSFEISGDGEELSPSDIDLQSLDEFGVLFGVAEGGVSIE